MPFWGNGLKPVSRHKNQPLLLIIKRFDMKNEIRECPQCGEVIEGRPNKKFCSDTCKGRHFREGNSLHFQIDSPTDACVSAVSSSASSYYPDDTWQTQDDEDNEWEKAQAEKRRLVEREHTAKLHEQFCGVVQDFLDVEGKALLARQTNRLLREVSDLTTAYQVHPHLKLPGNQINGRLKAMYGIQDILQEVIQEIESKVLWQSRKSGFEITKKRRKTLRELLIPD